MFLHCQIETVTKWFGFSSNVKHFKPLIFVLHNSSAVSGIETMHWRSREQPLSFRSKHKEKNPILFSLGGHQPNNAADFCEGFRGVITSFTHSLMILGMRQCGRIFCVRQFLFSVISLTGI